MSAVASGGPGLVAVGSFLSDEQSGDIDAAVWTSPDGMAWSRVPHDAAIFGTVTRPFTRVSDQAMNSVTNGGPGLVAVGQDNSGGFFDGAVWTSQDGLTWSRVPHDEGVFGGERDQYMVSVTVGGPGLVAVGWDNSRGDTDAAVWTSQDGLTWSRVPHDEGVFGGEGGQSMSGVTAGGPGVVAVGSEDSGGQSNAAVWTSPDGFVWSRVPHDEAILGGEGDQSMWDVTAGGPGLVAVGSEDLGGESTKAVVWTSGDGITWSRVALNTATFGGEREQSMESVTNVGSGLVAVGSDLLGDKLVAAVWTSSDGTNWSRVPHDDAIFGGEGSNQRIWDVVAGGPGLVAVGSDDSNVIQNPAVWVFTPGE